MTDAETKFHEERRTGVGGSDAAAVCGMSQFSDQHRVWLEKTDRKKPETVRADRLEAGVRLEAAIAEWFQDKVLTPIGQILLKPKMMLRHPEYPWMICHLDGAIYDKDMLEGPPISIAEVKNVALDQAWLWGDKADEIPKAYNIQCQHNMIVASGHFKTDIRHCKVPVMVGGNQPRFDLFVDRDEKLCEALIKIEKDFMHDYVEKDVPPPLDGSKGAGEVLAAKFPTHDELEIVALAPDNEWAEKFLRFRDEADKLERWMEEARNHLIESIGENAAIMTSFGRFTWKAQKRRTIDGKALAEHFGVEKDVLEDKFTKISEFRRFNPPRRKK